MRAHAQTREYIIHELAGDHAVIRLLLLHESRKFLLSGTVYTSIKSFK